MEGRRRCIARPGLFFVSSLFTSFAFAGAFYLATAERQRQLGSAIPDKHTPDVSSAPLAHAMTGSAPWCGGLGDIAYWMRRNLSGTSPIPSKLRT